MAVRGGMRLRTTNQWWCKGPRTWASASWSTCYMWQGSRCLLSWRRWKAVCWGFLRFLFNGEDYIVWFSFVCNQWGFHLSCLFFVWQYKNIIYLHICFCPYLPPWLNITLHWTLVPFKQSVFWKILRLNIKIAHNYETMSWRSKKWKRHNRVIKRYSERLLCGSIDGAEVPLKVSERAGDSNDYYTSIQVGIRRDEFQVWVG